jgi:hypothetical protein
MGEDFVRESGGVASQLSPFVIPAPSQRTRRNGAPTALLMPGRSKAWATRRIFPLAVLLSTGSRTVTQSYRAAPFQGWSVPTPPDAAGGALLTLPDSAQQPGSEGQNLTPHRARISTLPGQESLAEHSLLANHRKWKTNTITEKKAIRYAATQPNLRHSRLDFGHHAQQAYPASRAFGPRIKTCNHVGQAE